MKHMHRNNLVKKLSDNTDNEAQGSEVTEVKGKKCSRDSLSESFYDEIDSWARRALASNGFGDY